MVSISIGRPRIVLVSGNRGRLNIPITIVLTSVGGMPEQETTGTLTVTGTIDGQRFSVSTHVHSDRKIKTITVSVPITIPAKEYVTVRVTAVYEGHSRVPRIMGVVTSYASDRKTFRVRVPVPLGEIPAPTPMPRIVRGPPKTEKRVPPTIPPYYLPPPGKPPRIIYYPTRFAQPRISYRLKYVPGKGLVRVPIVMY